MASRRARYGLLNLLLHPTRPIALRSLYPAMVSTSYCRLGNVLNNRRMIGIISIDSQTTITLGVNAVFQPACDSHGDYEPTAGDPSTYSDLKDPFFVSTTPQIYAIAAATIFSYLLVIMLFITPRTFFIGGPGGGPGFLGRHGMIGGTYGGSSVVGVGRRPWLQKVATTTVAISLTIATSDTFRVVQRQYDKGYLDAGALTAEVTAGLELRIIRVISTTFLWLAQAQTLIRLFQRHKEKVMIKWIGFALIVLDTVFSILNNFVNQNNQTRPRHFVDAFPALSYLFELALGLLYAGWVLYYAMSKHRYAFYHPKMKNICLVALLSIASILVPVVFFVMDISKPDVARWGDYIRWVGAAAASVVVWEWVERIEALERDDKKDGILGREIFDGDEMLDVTPSEEVDWPARRRRHHRDGNESSDLTGQANPVASSWAGQHTLNYRPRRTETTFEPGVHPVPPRRTYQQDLTLASGALPNQQGPVPSPPPAVASPVSRTNTTSAASTLYAVRYHPINNTPSPSRPQASPTTNETVNHISQLVVHPVLLDTVVEHQAPADSLPVGQAASSARWPGAIFPFRRHRGSPPAEVATAQAVCQAENAKATNAGNQSGAGWKFISRWQDTAVGTISRLKPRSGDSGSEVTLPVTVIPANRTGQRTWSPQCMDDSFDDEKTEPSSLSDSSEQRHGTFPRHEGDPSSVVSRNSGLPPAG